MSCWRWFTVPRTRKPPGTAVDKRNGARLVSVGAGQVERCTAPRGLLASSKAAWEAFWDDRQSALLTPSGRVVLERWVRAVDRFERSTRAADKQPLVPGSTGQPVVNPLYRVADSARAVVEACERQLGVGGVYAASLGLAAVAEARSLADLNARYGEPDGGDDDADADPRVVRIVDAG
jgi:hypothetical protein